MKNEYKICSRCVMDTSDKEIVFDDHQQCNHCNQYFEQKDRFLKHGKEGEKELNRLVEKIKREGKNKKYDCIIGLSGGVDSTYVAYKVKKLGLRPLAVHFDSGWNSELAIKNIENIVKKLNFDLYTFVCDWSEMRDLQLSYFKAGVINADIPMDHAFSAVLRRIARKKGIKYFISGNNFETESILPKSWVYNSRDSLNLIDIQNKFGKVKLRKYPIEHLIENLYSRFIFGLKTIEILNYEKYKKEEVMDLIEEELGWRYYGGKHYESIFTRFYQGYYLPERFGVDKRRAHLSALICSGQISREEALLELSKPTYPDKDLLKTDLEFIPKKLGITEREFADIMKSPTHKHTEYKTDIFQRKIVDQVKNIIRKLK